MTTSSVRGSTSVAIAKQRAEATSTEGSYEGLMHAGAGSGLILVQLSAIIPGLLPALILLGLIVAVVLLPAALLGLAVALLLAPPYGVWRLATRGRRRRCAEEAFLSSRAAHIRGHRWDAPGP